MESEPLSRPRSPPPPAQQSTRPRPATKSKRPNYNAIHSRPLPVAIHPLPAFHPANPISLLRLVYVFISDALWPRSAIPVRYAGYYSPQTHSVHVTDPTHVRALWEQGFFGKGSLSRSEPNWADRERARRGREGRSAGAEAATNARREARRAFKLERARLEREKIERQRMVEEGVAMGSESRDGADDVEHRPLAETVLSENASRNAVDDRVPESSTVSRGNLSVEHGRSIDHEAPKSTSTPTSTQNDNTRIKAADIDEPDETNAPLIQNEEHLQLTPEEAFFLSYALGALTISTSPTKAPAQSALNALQTLHLFTSPPPSNENPSKALDSSHPFLISYAAYHHFRTLGWVVRSSVKFGVDFLLYQRGPVFSHAEFAVVVRPAYADPYWSTAEGRETRRRTAGEEDGTEKDWWWLHSVNRVQSQVLKTVVLCYVDVPPPVEDRDGKTGESELVSELLRRYSIREFVVKRWVPNRSRD